MKAFLSYVTAERAAAAEVAAVLAELGVETFMAHENIRVTGTVAAFNHRVAKERRPFRRDVEPSLYQVRVLPAGGRHRCLQEGPHNCASGNL
jgi:hypothetical protein